MTTDFKPVSQSEFDAVIEGIDRRRYKITKRCENEIWNWYFMPIQRRGLYRSAIRDVDKTKFAVVTHDSHSIGIIPQ